MSENTVRVYYAIREFIVKNGHSPAVRDIAEIVGLSQATVQWHIHRLVARGYVTKTERQARTLAITEKTPPKAQAA